MGTAPTGSEPLHRTGSVIYLDSSAIVKLVVAEPESAVLRGELAKHPEWVSSALARVEVLRALDRSEAPAATVRYAKEILDRIALVGLDEPILDAAATVGPPGLRSLGAVHLATAVSLAGLEAFVAYDRRLLSGAAAAGLVVLSPR